MAYVIKQGAALGKRAGKLSHVGEDGKAGMVNVSHKPITQRMARAEAVVEVSGELMAAIRANTLAKGDVLGAARLAGIAACKRTDELIPLCHTLPLDYAQVWLTLRNGRAGKRASVLIEAQTSTHSRTGVEMEALTAAAVAALTVIDMGKAIDKEMVITGLRVVEKRGGASGDWKRAGAKGGVHAK